MHRNKNSTYSEWGKLGRPKKRAMMGSGASLERQLGSAQLELLTPSLLSNPIKGMQFPSSLSHPGDYLTVVFKFNSAHSN